MGVPQPAPDPSAAQGLQALAALAYIFPLGLILWWYERSRNDYFLRYHCSQALLVNLVSVVLFMAPVAAAALVPSQPQSAWPLGVHIVLGAGISLMVLLLFALYSYCIVLAWLGRYTVLPWITTWTYAWLERRG
jgi:hypothetical protein